MVDGIGLSVGGFSSYYSLSQQNKSKNTIGVFSDSTDSSSQTQENKPKNENTQKVSPGAVELTEDQKKDVQELKKRDTEVKQHEQAHMSAAGGLARGGPKYEYETGPDGQQYAKAGHVNIDTSKEKEPQKTIEKAQAVKRAALAPSDPSGQDRKVAAQATQMETEARAQLSKDKTEGKEAQNPLEALSQGKDALDFTKKPESKDGLVKSPFDYQKRFEAYRANAASGEQKKTTDAAATPVAPTTARFES